MRHWGYALTCLGLLVPASAAQAQTPGALSTAAHPSDADVRRARALEHGTGGVTRDVAAAMRLYRQAADAGHVGAMNAVGQLAFKGDHNSRTVPDHSLALQYFRRAADRGHSDSVRRLAVFTGAGLAGVKRDMAAAMQMLDEADRRFPDSAGQRYNYSRMIADNVPLDTVFNRNYAAAWRFMTINQTLQFGPNTVGSAAMGGEINLFTSRMMQNYPEDFEELNRLFPTMWDVLSKVAARPDIRDKPTDMTAQKTHFLIHHFYLRGLGGAPRDPARGLSYLRLAGDNGDGPASHLLAKYHIETQHGLTRDVPEILRLLNRAIAQGDRQADYTLGHYHHNGWGARARGGDPKKALQHFRRAAEVNVPEALELAGTYLYEGLHGTPVNRNAAMAYYRRAADQGSALAALPVAMAYSDGSYGLTRNLKTGCEYFQKSVATRHAVRGHAYYHLGVCHERGYFGTADNAQALRNYRLALASGDTHPSAQSAYDRLNK